MNDRHFMSLAIEAARRGIDSGQSPFGAVIVGGGSILADTHNTVWLQKDPTAHAEVNAIRGAAARLKSIDLSGTTLYSTCEPCPMCLSAIHWAKIDKVVYGATIADAADAGFSELHLSAGDLVRLGKSTLRVEQGPLIAECKGLFEEWKKAAKSSTY